MSTLPIDQLVQENEDLRRRLEEAEDALRALRSGEVDAVLVEAEREQVYTLEQADKPYRLLVEQMHHAAATLTPDGAIIYCNRRFADLLQRPLRALLGKPIADFVAEGDKPHLDALLRDGQGEVLLWRSDETKVPVYLGVSVLQEGALGSCLMVIDMTEQRHYQELKRTQAALRESEARMAMELADTKLLQSISAQLIQEDQVDALYQRIVEAASTVMRSDMSSMQILHPERNELELLAWKGFHPKSAAFWKYVRLESNTSCGEAFRNGRRVIVPDVQTCEFIVDPADIEANRWSGVRAVQSTPLISRTGRLLGMISTHWRQPHQPSERDLSLLDVLARQAADLIERKRTEQALRDADRKKDEFLATLAHELRNPLAPIRNSVQILKAKGPPLPELQWARDVIDRQVHVMARLLEDLLDISRISHNMLELRRERIVLAAVVESAVETSRPVIEAGRHELTVTLPPEPIYLDADPVRLAQVFANLLNNAAKYTEKGGHIQLSAQRRGSEVIVSVKDDGIGISSEMLPRIFEIFAQAKRALVRSQGGLGVGLSLVKGLVELQGGSIVAQSGGQGQGSEFLVRLPVPAETPNRELSLPRENEGQRPVPSRRILIVDDNQDSADSLAMLLRVMGHEVGTAYDGEEAIAAAEALRPEVVLLDIGMPRLNGYDACRRLREQPWGRGMFLIALTGWGQEDDRRQTEEAGFNHHIVKPVDAAALMKLLASLAADRGSVNNR
jgi:signal transduction histidine kinase/ActR/RegA family two-component response regulator